MSSRIACRNVGKRNEVRDALLRTTHGTGPGTAKEAAETAPAAGKAEQRQGRQDRPGRAGKSVNSDSPTSRRPLHGKQVGQQRHKQPLPGGNFALRRPRLPRLGGVPELVKAACRIAATGTVVFVAGGANQKP